ncbi:hypothetical protein M2282_004520 [Variovorax boronicumulans]|uniref:hypothetical protein n=1 Tax=Variovorax boronicumulans TaxID=436515 RepID=UPI002473C4A7|nr:hypothetical protein [Variovorax boronicumulans]MDH6169356.1 hypothetical protein [Variovorax boronicumulans]
MNARSHEVTSLSSDKEAEVVALRETLRRLGSGFEFAVCGVAADVDDVGEAHHRAVLRLLCDDIEAGAQRYRREAIARDPSLASVFVAGFAFDTDVDAARATPLEASAVVRADSFAPQYYVDSKRDPEEVSWFEWFCEAFGHPPHLLRVADAADCAQLFSRFCQCTGLLSGEDIVVLDWVGDPEREPERSKWSNYFDDGKEWWGIWCFTVWNPRRRILAAAMASQTD